MKKNENQYVVNLFFIIIYLSFSIVYYLLDGYRSIGVLLLFLNLLAVAIIIVESRLISLAKLFVVNFFALNYASLFYFTVLDSGGEKYVFVTHMAFALFVLTYHVFSKRNESYSEYELYTKLDMSRIGVLKAYLLFTPIIFSLVFMVVQFGPGALIDFSSHTRADTKEANGFLWLIAKYSLMFYLPCSFIQGFYIPKAKLRHKLLIILTFVILMIMVFLFLRTRTYLLGPIVTMAFGFLFSIIGRKSESISISGRQYIKIAMFAIIIISLAASARFIRGIIEVGEGSLNFGLIAEKTLVEGDLGYGHMIDKIIKYSDDFDIKLYGQSYYRLILSPIPRSIYEGKPENTQRIVGKWLYPNSTFMTVPPGIQGDAYINFGVLGVVVFIIFGSVCRVIDNNISVVNGIFVASSFMPMFHLVRGGFTNPIIILAFTYIFAVVVYNVFIIKKA
ncbi:O-antigen polymerase [Vibrio campbellii]|uniref:O-antigen polymerase n=1 Tax=Vibrio campbellii TaxID=680 RepID=UPI001E30BF93|nr:O-antigen polymerase [Vibrio campbellii]MCC8252540.1 oligosaccharide repeat unit polymerase [Vibrio campbellii CAIM 333]